MPAATSNRKPPRLLVSVPGAFQRARTLFVWVPGARPSAAFLPHRDLVPQEHEMPVRITSFTIPASPRPPSRLPRRLGAAARRPHRSSSRIPALHLDPRRSLGSYLLARVAWSPVESRPHGFARDHRGG